MKNFDITKVDKDWVITLTVPIEQKTYNPYDEEDVGIMDNICGVVDKNLSSWGFAYLIDMNYKGKPPQWSANFVECSGFMEEEEFIKLCEDNKIVTII